MTIQIARIAALVPAALLALTTGLAAQTYERPPSFAADKIRGIKPVGENYTIKSPVRSDGLFRVYDLTTPYGPFTVQGDQMLRMRLNELAALHELEKVSGSEAFSKALVEAGLSPIKYTGKLIVDPVRTIGDTFAGVGSFLGGLTSGMANAGKTQDNALAGLLGVTSQRRQLAAKLGVDPYTDYAPLAEKMRQLSEAAATGGLVVTGALMAIPGAAGIVVSNLATANRLGDMRIEELARNYSAAQILDLNRQRLLAMGVDKTLAETLLANRNFTPIDLAAMVAALDSMPNVSDCTVFIARAAGVNARATAYFMRRHAEMVAAHYARTGAFTRFVSLGGYPFNVARDGSYVGLMPVDVVSWTESTAKAFGDSTSDLRRLAPGGAGEIRITGTATSAAKQRLKELGWRLVENARI